MRHGTKETKTDENRKTGRMQQRPFPSLPFPSLPFPSLLHGLLERLEDYCILDESHYSEMELDATYENIPLAAYGVKDDYDLPEDWAEHVYDWLSNHRCSALENVDDQGGWPDEDDLRATFDALGYPQVEAAC